VRDETNLRPVWLRSRCCTSVSASGCSFSTGWRGASYQPLGCRCVCVSRVCGPCSPCVALFSPADCWATPSLDGPPLKRLTCPSCRQHFFSHKSIRVSFTGGWMTIIAYFLNALAGCVPTARSASGLNPLPHCVCMHVRACVCTRTRECFLITLHF
jgi:hypothetical protein